MPSVRLYYELGSKAHKEIVALKGYYGLKTSPELFRLLLSNDFKRLFPKEAEA